MTRWVRMVLLCGSIAAVVLPNGIATASTPDGEEASPDSTDDPVIRDVARMLGEGVDSAIIMRWLDSTRARPGTVSADAVIELTRAGASAELIDRLLELAAATAGPPPRPLPDGTGTPGCCGVDFSIVYKSVEDVEGEDELESPDLFVYLDGAFLARVISRGDIAPRPPLEFRSFLEPGMHVIRLTRELHTPKGGNKARSWTHESRVSPDIIEIEIAPGAEWDLELRWVERVFTSGKKGPLTWTLLRDGQWAAGVKQSGADKDRWPRLCDDLKANLKDPDDPPRWYVDALENCVWWAGLWEGQVPERTEVRDRLRSYDFKPTAAALDGPPATAPRDE